MKAFCHCSSGQLLLHRQVTELQPQLALHQGFAPPHDTNMPKPKQRVPMMLPMGSHLSKPSPIQTLVPKHDSPLAKPSLHHFKFTQILTQTFQIFIDGFLTHPNQYFYPTSTKSSSKHIKSLRGRIGNTPKHQGPNFSSYSTIGFHRFENENGRDYFINVTLI